MENREKERIKAGKIHLIVGRAGSGKSKYLHNYSKETGIPILDLDSILGKKIPEGKDSQYVYGFIDGFLSTYRPDEILLDKKSILYDKDSNIDILGFLRKISKEKIVIATWNGYTKDGILYHIGKNQEVDAQYDLAYYDIMYTEIF